MTVDVPSETWEGEGATMTCSHPNLTKAFRVYWYNGTGSGTLIYIYKPRLQAGLAVNDQDNRFEGQVDGNVHKFTISPTSVEDEGTYTCKVDAQHATGMLTVNGEYLKKGKLWNHRMWPVDYNFMLVFLTITKCCV